MFVFVSRLSESADSVKLHYKEAFKERERERERERSYLDDITKKKKFLNMHHVQAFRALYLRNHSGYLKTAV